MRVAIDGTPLTEPSGGIARYTAELTAALAAEFPEDEYWLASDQSWDAWPVPAGVRIAERPRHWLTRRWWLVGLPIELRRLRVEVFHGTDFAVPHWSPCASVMTMHDLSPWAPKRRRPPGSDRVRRRAPHLMRQATMIITPTETVRRELIDRFGMSPSRVVVVPEAAGEQFRASPGTRVPPGVAAPFVLFVGTREPRKNLNRLVDAWRQVRIERPDLSLVLVGRDGGADLRQEPGLRILGRLPDAEVAALMARAELFVYPSLYEGFGLPVLEAMQAGAPVVISQDRALVEVAGDAAVRVDAASTSDLARAILALLGDPARRQELVDRGRRRAAEFSWRRTAILTREVYQEAIRRF